MYSNPERWSLIQKRGFLVDNKKQLIIPLIAFKRSSIEKDDSLSVDKLDPKDPKLFYTFQKQYTRENRYDNFAESFYRKVQKSFLKISKNKKNYFVLNSSLDNTDLEKKIFEIASKHLKIQ